MAIEEWAIVRMSTMEGFPLEAFLGWDDVKPPLS